MAIYENSRMGKFIRQRANANRRKIGWELSFDEWAKIWDDSGKWEMRGRKQDQYCMSRKLDQGTYAVDNVEIKLSAKNSSEAFQDTLTHFKPVAEYQDRAERTIVWEHRDNPKVDWIALDWKHPTPLEAYPSGYLF